MSLGRFVPPPSPIDAINKALGVAESVYGIKGASQKAEQIQRAMDLQAQQNDANSAVSQERRATTGALLNTLQRSGEIPGDQVQGITALLPKMSAANLENDSAMKSLIGLQEEREKAKAMAAAAGVRNQSYSDKNGIQVAKDYDSQMAPYRQLNEDVSRVESALATKDKNGKPLITPQQLGDANLAISRIFSPKHQSDSTVAATEYQSIPAQFAAALQKFTTDPTDINSRDLINHIIDQAHHIANVTNDNALKQLQALDEGYKSFSSPEIQNIAAKKSNFYLQRFGKKYTTVGASGAPDSGGMLENSANAGEPGGGSDIRQAALMEIQRRRSSKGK